jgi:hypothetical protein
MQSEAEDGNRHGQQQRKRQITQQRRAPARFAGLNLVFHPAAFAFLGTCKSRLIQCVRPGHDAQSRGRPLQKSLRTPENRPKQAKKPVSIDFPSARPL